MLRTRSPVSFESSYLFVYLLVFVSCSPFSPIQKLPPNHVPIDFNMTSMERKQSIRSGHLFTSCPSDCNQRGRSAPASIQTTSNKRWEQQHEATAKQKERSNGSRPHGQIDPSAIRRPRFVVCVGKIRVASATTSCFSSFVVVSTRTHDSNHQIQQNHHHDHHHQQQQQHHHHHIRLKHGVLFVSIIGDERHVFSRSSISHTTPCSTDQEECIQRQPNDGGPTDTLGHDKVTR